MGGRRAVAGTLVLVQAQTTVEYGLGDRRREISLVEIAGLAQPDDVDADRVLHVLLGRPQEHRLTDLRRVAADEVVPAEHAVEPAVDDTFCTTDRRVVVVADDDREIGVLQAAVHERDAHLLRLGRPVRGVRCVGPVRPARGASARTARMARAAPCAAPVVDTEADGALARSAPPRSVSSGAWSCPALNRPRTQFIVRMERQYPE